ncbi:DNA repair protein RadA, partial [Acidobacteria bacterium AH-259-G07]|nr:DNA repair protein RadA [Acidobacteria bacterium AH-259-G07]
MVSPSHKILHVCQSCGFRSSKWLGRCPECAEWNSLVEEGMRPLTAVPAAPPTVPYSDIDSQTMARIKTHNAEFDRVLGGGIVPGSLVLLGGEPGIGKSTLLLQIAEGLSHQNLKVLYVAGEESAQQIKLRGDRLGIGGARLYLAAETCLEHIFEEISHLKPAVLIVDSVQTIYTGKLDSIPGSIGQIRECAAQLLSMAKREGVPVFLIGHITKDGALAGPKALEHIVDTVLYFEGDRHQNHKIVRAVKNRFGPSNELGIFQMSSRGLLCVDNPSHLFLAERARKVSGSVVLCAMEGSRPVLVEIQALVSQSNYSTSRRMTNGVDPNRVSLLIAMLEKRVGLHLLGSDVYVNVAGGLTLIEPAVDLAIVAAIISSFRDLPLSNETVIFGEVGLAGEIRAVSFAHSRVKEAASQGFKTVILPKSNLPLSQPIQDLQLAGVSSVSEFLQLFNSPDSLDSLQ